MGKRQRVEELEARARRARLAGMPIEELERIVAGGSPEETAIVRRLTDAELGQIIDLPDAELGRFWQSMVVKYGGQASHG